MFRTLKQRNPRDQQRAKQLEYQKDLDKQVTLKQQQKLQELARQHANKYAEQFGLVDKIASAPDSGFSVSPRYNTTQYPQSGFGGNGGLARTKQPSYNQQQQNQQGGRQLNDQLTTELEERFRHVSKAFLAADVDRSGSLDVGELRRLCNMYNLPADRVESAFALSDMDHDGQIQYSEFASKLTRPDYPSNTNAPIPGANTYNNNNQIPNTNNLTTTRYKNTLGSMWQGTNNNNSDNRTKRQLQNEYQQELSRQVEERKQREVKAKLLEQDDERRANNQARQHNPWGRGGAGAPLTDERGRMITDLRDVHEVAQLGGVSPKQDRGYGGGPETNQIQQVTGGGGYNRRQVTYGSPTRIGRGGHTGNENINNQNNLPYNSTGNGRFRMSNAAPELQAEYTARATKQDILKSALSVQIEEKRIRTALDKQRRVEMERKEEERVKREQAEIKLQYQMEHRAQMKKEADLKEANRLAADNAKSRNNEAKKASAAVLNMPDANSATREQAFSPQRSALRTPPPLEGYARPAANTNSSSSSSSGGGGGRRNGGSMTVLRRELNDQHSSLLRKIEEQRSTIDLLRKNFDMFQQGGMTARGGNNGGNNGGNYGTMDGGYGGGGGGGNNYGNSYEPQQQQQQQQQQNGWAPGRDDLSNVGKVVLQNIDVDDPDQLDNLLLDFVNKRGGYGPGKMEMPEF